MAGRIRDALPQCVCVNVPMQHATKLHWVAIKVSTNCCCLAVAYLSNRPCMGTDQQNLVSLCGNLRALCICSLRLTPTCTTSKTIRSLCSTSLSKRKCYWFSRYWLHWPKPDHFRIVTLPHIEDLEAAIGRLERFYRLTVKTIHRGLAQYEEL